MSEWKPIETAPKDGTEFQVWVQKYGWEPRARYKKGVVQIRDDEFGWEEWFDQSLIRHWMPIPAPPNA